MIKKINLFILISASSFYSIFTPVPKTFNGTVALNVGLLKHSLFMLSLSQFVLFLHVIPDRLDEDQIRSLCGALAVVRLLVQTKISLDNYN